MISSVYIARMARMVYRTRSLRRGQPDLLIGEEASVDAAELWQAVQPTDPEHPTSEENQQLDSTRWILGWLHYLRNFALRGGPEASSELAHAIFYLAPLARNTDSIPEPVQKMMRATADANELTDAAVYMLEQAQATTEGAIVDAAILLLKASVATTTGDHFDRARFLCILSIAHQMRFERSGMLADIDQAVMLGAQAVAATPDDYPDRGWSLSNLGNAHRERFERNGVWADIDQAVNAGTHAVTATPDGHPQATARLANLGASYRLRFEHGGALEDLDQVVALGIKAVATTPDGHPHRAKTLSDLGIAYQARFKSGGVLADLDHAIENDEQAVAETPAWHPDFAGRLSNLAIDYQMRFGHAGTVADIDQAVALGAQAVVATPDDHPQRAMYLFNLGFAYQARYEHGGVLADLDQAIESDKQAVATAPDDHPQRARFLSILCFAYQTRFERGGVLADLDQAAALGAQAVAATPENHPDRGKILDGLSSVYRVQFERSGVMAYINRAVQLGTQAVAAANESDPERDRFFANLGVAYQLRFDRGGMLADLDQAIENGELALTATPDSHSSRAIVLFDRGSGVLSEILQLIEKNEPVILATHNGRSRLASVLSNLCIDYRVRFEHSGLPTDIERAIELGWQALHATPNNHQDLPRCLANLGEVSRVLFERSGELDDLEQAIELGWQAVAAAASDHPYQAVFLSNLSLDYTAKLHATGQALDSQILSRLARGITAATTAPPTNRVRAARAAGSLAHALGENNLAVELLDAAVNMLPSISRRESGRADQEHSIIELLGIAEESFAAHCALNDPVGAVGAAELSRGILLAALLDSQSDHKDLDRAHPDLAADFHRVRDLLNTPEVADNLLTSPHIESVDQIEHRKRLWTEHDQILARIRQQPAFASFLLPPSLADLQRATAGGAAIMVNTGLRRSDAVIITAETNPVHVPLPDATFTDVTFHAQALLDAVQDRTPVGSLRRQRVIPETLGWLWDAVVQPILKMIPSPADRTSALPRVWWLPTGLLGLFPLHAAGHLGQTGALDTVASSYIPTLRALAHARTRPPAAVRRQLTVALHHTPGLPDLPGTVSEATTLHAHHSDARLLLDDAATTSSVLNALTESTWAHFACHARVDLTTPSQGGLALYDATLPLLDISQLHLVSAELAYLSACSTADRGVPLADESLHLASAFQLAGFRHVIASLWPLNDGIAAKAAEAVYRYLPDTPTADHAAIALHHVVLQLRDEHPGRPDLWAALVHSGP